PSDPTKEAWQTGMLVLIPEIVNGEPLTLNRLWELMEEKYFPSTEADYENMSPSVAAEYGETPAGKSEWILIEQGVFPDSRNKKIQEQEAMIKPPYQLPELLPMTALMILKYLNSPNKERLFSNSPWTFIRCKETIKGYHVVVGGFAAAGLLVSYYRSADEYDHAYVGVGALRKFGP
ncbi:MAG: hypothetical protein V4489_04735, partial [Chlamydiota bacterium]